MPITIVAIAGASGSGKTTVAEAVYKHYQSSGRNVVKISVDNYYRRDPVEGTNFDHPDSVELDLFKKHLNELREGKTVEIPTYSFVRSNREEATIRIKPSDNMILIVEGIFALNPTLTSGVDMVKIFVDTPMDISVLRRLERDVRERGREWGTGAADYLNTVRPMYIAHIEPTKKAADLVIENSNSEDIVRAISQVEYKITYPKQCAFTMQVLSGFIAALGIAAVATAFVALNAATLGAAGLALGAVGAVAIGLGVAGLFKYKPEPTMAPSVMPTERFALS